MTNDELRMILITSGYQARVKGDEVLIEVCVFCSNPKWNLELNGPKGVFRCWACKTGGRLDELLKQLTGQQHRIQVQFTRDKQQVARPVEGKPEFASRAIEDVPTAAFYLAERGFDASVCKAYGLVVCIEEGHQLYGRIVIPVREFWSAQQVGWVGRSYTGGWPKYLSLVPVMQVTGWRASGKRTPVVVVEGHLDGLTVHRAGFSAAVLGGTGVKDVGEWAGRLLPETPTFVMMDGDAPEATMQLYWNIVAVRGEQKTRAIMLDPHEDPASLGSEIVRLRVLEAVSGVGGTSAVGEVQPE